MFYVFGPQRLVKFDFSHLIHLSCRNVNKNPCKAALSKLNKPEMHEKCGIEGQVGRNVEINTTDAFLSLNVNRKHFIFCLNTWDHDKL